MVQQYNTARGAVEEEEAERALQAAYLQEEEGGGGWAEEEWEQAEEEPQQPQPQQRRWQAFQAQEDEVGAWCVLGALCGLDSHGVEGLQMLHLVQHSEQVH